MRGGAQRRLQPCQKPLVRLLAGCRGVDDLIGRGEDLAPFDIHAPLLSLPGIFRTFLETIPADVPYLFADGESIEHWRRELRPIAGFKVGIAWRGSPTHSNDRARSFPLSYFESLAGLPGIQLLSLQKGVGAEELQQANDRFPITELGSRLEDFLDTAAVMRHLDLVIACDTAVAHLAGALGVPVWVALPFVPDWRGCWIAATALGILRCGCSVRTDEEIGKAYSGGSRSLFASRWPVKQFAPTRNPEARISSSCAEAHRNPGNAFSCDTLRLAGRVVIIYVMATISEALAIAVQHHQAGRLQAAEQIYRKILAVEPNQCDAWHLLGVINAQTGNHQRAVEYIYRALAVKPDWADAQANLGNALREQGKLDEAVPFLQRALQLKPDFAEAHSNLGNALREQGKLDEATACYRRALELKPDFAEAHNNLGTAFNDQRKLDEAVACYRRALQLKPDFAEAHNNLGIVLNEQGKLDQAVACYRRALQLKPGYAEAHNNLGIVLNAQGKLDEAVACYRRALELKPDFAGAQYNLGNALKDQGKLDGAVACYRRALQLKSDYAEAHINLGVALKNQGKLDDALACYRRALELQPDFADAHWNQSLLSLLTGDFERGWAEYQWRWKTKQSQRRDFSQALWDGQPLEGRTILLHAEQGLGDAIQFVRYAPLVKRAGARVLVECQKVATSRSR
jgi:tetratricopeptide (TPR) repeat protein